MSSSSTPCDAMTASVVCNCFGIAGRLGLDHTLSVLLAANDPFSAVGRDKMRYFETLPFAGFSLATSYPALRRPLSAARVVCYCQPSFVLSDLMSMPGLVPNTLIN